jgi:hypothetical protein
VSKYEGEIDFEAVRGYHKIEEQSKWHLMEMIGAGSLLLVEF